MYYFAFTDPDTGICLDVMESESIITDAYWVQLDALHKEYIYRKRYENGQWVDTTAEEAVNVATKGEHVAIFNEWLDVVLNNKAEIDHVHDDYATTNHAHDGYVSSDDLQVLTDVVATKADASHTHTEYAATDHTHDGYATQIALDTLGSVVDGKASVNHSHDEYANVSHSHSNYAEVTHDHEGYSLTTHTHTADEIGAAASGHNHDSAYAAISHSHDDTYYTETEVDTLLSSKANASHTHASVYDAYGSAADALVSAQEYTDSKIDALVGEGASTTLDTIGEISSAIEDNQDAIDLLNAAIANKANSSDLTVHASDTEIHVSEAEKATWNAKQAAITGGASTIASANLTSNRALVSDSSGKVAVSAVTSTELGYLDGVTSNVQTQLDGKAASSHTHNYAASSHTHSNYASTVATTGTGNAVTSVSQSGNTITVTKGSTFLTAHPTIATSSDATSTASPAHGGTFTAVDSVTRDSNGHVTKINTKTVTLPAQYTHPSYTARTGVPTANVTLSHGGTFTVTQPVCDATGHITALNTRTYTLPSDNNTDTKVTNTLATTTKAYVTGTTSATTNTGTQVFDTGVYLDTTAGKLTATTFNGTTFSGSGVATVSEVQSYLAI